MNLSPEKGERYRRALRRTAALSGLDELLNDYSRHFDVCILVAIVRIGVRLAGSLQNKKIAKRLEQFFDVLLPQEDGGLMVDMIGEGIHPSDAAKKVFRIDLNALKECEILLILLDGRTIDEGAAFELGYAFALGKTCVGLQTDIRRLLTTGNNPMIDCGLNCMFQDVEELIAWARQITAAPISIPACPPTIGTQERQ